MPLGIARKAALVPYPWRVGQRAGLAVCFLFFGSHGLQSVVAEGDTRTIAMHHMHTGEDINITFKRNGRYDDDALKKLDWFLRDWRRQQSTHMDPHLIDLIWEVTQEVGAKEPIEVVCGYRSPETNAMLRHRSRGVAQYSQHTLGRAMDFYIPGVSLERLRIAGLQLQRGGVGFYPSSGSPNTVSTCSGGQWTSISPGSRSTDCGSPDCSCSAAASAFIRHPARPSSISIPEACDIGRA